LKRADLISNKIVSLPELLKRVRQWKFLGKKIAFTNGVFDILHQGHIFSLTKAAVEADILIVGLNADSSVRRLKGNDRPVNDQQARATVLSALAMVDAVTVFEEDTPLELITAIMPDVLIKGGDYSIDQIAGAKEVVANGGRVVINPILEGYSTTSLINKFTK
jgi:rfaE bifunctional protein nucleotidyltransferase chain/domain